MMSTALKLPSVFANHMVLQRDLPLPIWGWADPAGKVTVSIAGQTATATADAEGRWKVPLAPLAAGGPLELKIASGSQTVTLTDVLVGDVWLCSGQSNMEWEVTRSIGGAEAIAAADQPRIRLMQLPRVFARKRAFDVDAAWKICTPESVKNFSGVGYFFGQQLQKNLDVPIGLINSSWGGTAAESWTPLEDLQGEPSLKYLGNKMDEPEPKNEGPYIDSGNKGVAMGWAKVQFDDANWGTIKLPQAWQAIGLNVNGSVWFRRTVNLPADMAGKPIMLHPGVCNDFDVTYFNGEQVGSIGKETHNWWTVPRHYRIDGKHVKAGLNTIAVRVFDQWGDGGMLGPVDEMRVHPEGDPSRTISLAGDWKYQVEEAFPYTSPSQSILPTVLFNAMISPLLPFGIRGVIWYQGESNAARAAQYRTLFPTMIRAWRREFGHGDFPFLFVQLANYIDKSDSAAGSKWAELRDAQTSTLTLPNTGQAVIIDIGEATDIHPQNKRDVGLRLAHEAMRIACGKDAPRSPMVESTRFDGGHALVTFKFAQDGLQSRGEPAGFVLAGEDRVFHAAKAVIDGSTVTVSSDAVKKPVAVRYGWAENPTCTLYNAAGLPTCPFRSDDWPAVTANAK